MSKYPFPYDALPEDSPPLTITGQRGSLYGLPLVLDSTITMRMGCEWCGSKTSRFLSQVVSNNDHKIVCNECFNKNEMTIPKWTFLRSLLPFDLETPAPILADWLEERGLTLMADYMRRNG